MMTIYYTDWLSRSVGISRSPRTK